MALSMIGRGVRALRSTGSAIGSQFNTASPTSCTVSVRMAKPAPVPMASVRGVCTSEGVLSDQAPPRTLALNTLRPNPGARKQKRRVGRGPGTGRGKTSTRGHKGQRARQGGSVPLGFEGGQTPLHIRVPKRGFNNKKFGRVYRPLGLERVQHWIDMGRLDPSKPITLKELQDSGVVGKIKQGIALVGTNASKLTTPINIEVSRASQSAIAAVESVGGSVTSVYHSPLALRALLKPHKFAVPPKAPLPPPKQMKYYVRDDKRGYLSRHVQLRRVVEEQQQKQ